MSIYIIAAVCKNTGIGYNNTLPWQIKEDLEYFKSMTLNKNIVMGRKTYDSIGKLLPNRSNIIINKEFTINDFMKTKKNNEDYYIIGGGNIYKQFINIVDTIYITYIDKNYKCDIFFPEFPNYKIKSYSEKMYSVKESCNYYFLTYQKINNIHSEYQYLNLINDILLNGNNRIDRTGTGTKSLFGNILKFKLDCLPLLTTKFINYKLIIKELLWFLRGETDSKILEKQGVNIWKGNTSREFLDNKNLNYEVGDIGPMYGFNLIHYGTEYKGCHYDYTDQGINQLEEVINLLKTDPFSRRIMMTTYNVNERNNGVLYPCHGNIIQFYCEEINQNKYLSCHMYQRSADVFLGLPFNIASYSILTQIIALKVDMIPKELSISLGDAHIYNNLLEQVKLQITRTPYPFPLLKINSLVKNKNFKEINIEDFEVVGYIHHDMIKGEMSV
jgi:dihydrofolate reductase/thymidylate synthase